MTDIDDPDPNWFLFWPNPPKLKSAPYVSYLHELKRGTGIEPYRTEVE